MNHDRHDSHATTATCSLSRLRRLADDVDLGLPPKATANALRAVVADMVREQHRAAVLANACGGTPMA